MQLPFGRKRQDGPKSFAFPSRAAPFCATMGLSIFPRGRIMHRTVFALPCDRRAPCPAGLRPDFCGLVLQAKEVLHDPAGTVPNLAYARPTPEDLRRHRGSAPGTAHRRHRHGTGPGLQQSGRSFDAGGPGTVPAGHRLDAGPRGSMQGQLQLEFSDGLRLLLSGPGRAGPAVLHPGAGTASRRRSRSQHPGGTSDAHRGLPQPSGTPSVSADLPGADRGSLGFLCPERGRAAQPN